MWPSLLIYIVWVTSTWVHDVEGDVKITLLHTNDVHARYEQFNKYGSVCSDSDASEGKCFGGCECGNCAVMDKVEECNCCTESHEIMQKLTSRSYARLATAVKEMRAKFPDSLLLDGGDQYQGSIWFYQFGGNVTSYFMNWVGYDVMTFGNHEFDRGVSGLVPFLKAVNFTVVSCNTDVTQEPSMAGLFDASTVRTVAGKRVGIIGYTTEDTPDISSPGKTLFHPIVPAVTQEVSRLRQSGVDIIIALGHGGFTVDKEVAQISGVDVVIGGHSNSFLYTGTPPSSEVPIEKYPYALTRSSDGKKVLTAQCYTMAKYLCVMHVTFNDAGDVTQFSGNPWLLNSSVAQDPATEAELRPWRHDVQNATSTVVGRTLVMLKGDRTVCRAEECNMGNLIADGMVHQNLRHPNELQWNDVTIALVNGGSIRASMGRGDISIGDVMTVAPFGNTIDTFTIKGKYLWAAMEHSVYRLDPCNKENLFGGFLQVSGLRVKYNLKKPPGQRVVSISALCTRCLVPEYRPLELEKVYKVVANSFVVGGGDGYSVIRDNVIDNNVLGDLDSDVLIEYIKTTSPIIQGIEGRIQFVDNSNICQSTSATAPIQSKFGLVTLALMLCGLFLGQN